MPTWLIDVQEKCGQRVLPTGDSNPVDRRFRKVTASTFGEAMIGAQAEVRNLAKLDQVLAGVAVIMSGQDLDWLIDTGLLPTDVASAPNPSQVGVLDAYLVGKISNPSIHALRAKHGLPGTNAALGAP